MASALGDLRKLFLSQEYKDMLYFQKLYYYFLPFNLYCTYNFIFKYGMKEI